jgi:hypothetical protein
MYVKKVYVCGEMYVGKCMWENVRMWENVIICGKMYVGKCRAMYVKDVCGEINVGEKCLNIGEKCMYVKKVKMDVCRFPTYVFPPLHFPTYIQSYISFTYISHMQIYVCDPQYIHTYACSTYKHFFQRCVYVCGTYIKK